MPSCFSPASHDAIAFAGTLDELVNVTVFTSLLVIGPLNAGESDEELVWVTNVSYAKELPLSIRTYPVNDLPWPLFWSTFFSL